MQITPKTNLEEFSLPLPIYRTIHIADAVGKNNHEFSLLIGLDKNLVSQLKKYSLDLSDIEIQTFTSDKIRFGEGIYEDWYKKNRAPFALVQKNTNILAALIWFGPTSFEQNGNWHTVAWRAYNPFRGKRLMKEFIKFTMDFYVKKIPNIKFWASIKIENTGSIKLAGMLGFQEVKEKSNNISCVMVKN
jgi:RimJ/RimL family protein N-acetyltransferase